MDKTQPSSTTIIGLVIGAIVLVAGILLISNTGGGTSADVPIATQTRVALQPTATPESEASPIPGERRTTEEDPDGDTFIGDADFCPDVFGEFDGCPDTDGDGIGDSKDACIDRGDEGYGIDTTGCPNPPIDTDNDGVFDNDDTCPADGDMGNGVDSVGCPIMVMVPDNAPAVMPYEFTGLGGVTSCNVVIINVGDGDPYELGRINGLIPNENGTIAGEIGILIGANDTPEANIECVGTPPLPPAIAAISYEFDAIPDANCQIIITDEGGTAVAFIPAVADENGKYSGTYEYDPGVVINPTAGIGCVPNSAPAVMPYEFTGLPVDSVCSVSIINIGDGDPLVLGEVTGLIPDVNGNLSGTIGIVVGANDVPEAQIGCAIVGDPPVPLGLFEYNFTDQPTDAVMCDVVFFNDAQEQVAVIDALPNSDGVISGIYEYDPAQILPTSAQVFCALNSSIPSPAVLNYEFTVTGTPVCEVLIIDEGGVTVITLPALISLDGVISGSYEYDPEVVPNPRAELACEDISVPGTLFYNFSAPIGAEICVVRIFFDGAQFPIEIPGTIGEDGMISGSFEYDTAMVQNPRAELFCDSIQVSDDAVAINMGIEGVCQIIEGAAVAVFTLTNPNDSDINHGYTDQNGVAGEAYVPANSTSTVNIIPNVDGFARIKFTGVANFAEVTGCVVAPEASPELTPAPETTEIVPLPPYEVSIVAVCYSTVAGDFVRFELTFTGNAPESIAYELTSGGSSGRGVLTIADNQAVLDVRKLSPTILAVFDDNDNLWTADADACIQEPEATPAPEGTPEPIAYDLDIVPVCYTEEGVNFVRFDVYVEGVLPAELDYQLTWGISAQTGTLTIVEGEPVFYTHQFAEGVSIASFVLIDGDNMWSSEADCTYNFLGYTFDLTEPFCSNDADSLTEVFFRITPSGDVPDTIFSAVVTSGDAVTNYPLLNFVAGETANITGTLGTNMTTASLTITNEDGIEWTFTYDCLTSTGDQPSTYELSATGTCTSENDVVNFAQFNLSATGEFPEFYVARLTTANEETLVYFSLTPASPSVFLGIQDNAGLTGATLLVTALGETFVWRFDYACETSDLPEVYTINIEKSFSGYQETSTGGLNAPVQGGNGPTENIDNLITATSSLGRAECDWIADGYLYCEYYAMIQGVERRVDYLVVPVGEAYTVTELAQEGWVAASGIGTFTYAQCQAGNIDTGSYSLDEYFTVVGYCYHRVENVVPDTESWTVVDIAKEWLPPLDNLGGLSAPAGGYSTFAPTYDIPALIVVTSEVGSLICDWYGAFGGSLDCRVEFTNRPIWFNYFDELPVPPGGSYTVTENIPDGWQNVGGLGTFTLDSCTDRDEYTTDYMDANGEEQTITYTECNHDVLNTVNEFSLDGYYGVQIEKIWEEIEQTAQLSGLNSPVLGNTGDLPGPDQSYYPLITVSSSLGTATCQWSYWSWGDTDYSYLDCYYNHNPNAPVRPYDFLLVPVGETYTVTEVAIDGYVNISGVGTFGAEACQFEETIPVGDGYEYEYDIDVCRHVVVNRETPTEDLYRVQIGKSWRFDDYRDEGLGAPAQGGLLDGPTYDIANFITAESSLSTAVCSWDYDFYDSQLVCVYAPKDGQTIPDTTSLWVPAGESYTVTETVPENWTTQSGTGTFDFSTCTYTTGSICYHRVVNYTDDPEFSVLFIDKVWLNFICDEFGEFEDCFEDCYEYDDCYEECYDCEASTNGLGAPASGGYETPGPAFYIPNLITVTSEGGTMTCSWVPSYYDAYFDITLGYLDCRVTTIAEGYPPFPYGLFVPAGGTYTVTENVPEGYVSVFGTGTFSIDECGFGGPTSNASALPVGYGEKGFECYHLVANDLSDISTPEPTPDVTPDITPDVTPDITPDVTPEATATPEVTSTPETTATPEATTTPDITVTPETSPVPTDVVTEEPPAGVCGDYTTDADGFPIINLSSRFCGDDSEGQVVNFEPIETEGDICVPETLYHSNANGTWDIFRTSANITPENLTNGATGVISMAPSRSPNGRYVTFVSNADGDWEIYLLDLDGENKLMQLTNNENAIDLDPVFSPNGRFIAYESNVDGNWEIRIIDLTTGEKLRVTNHPANDINPFWHPDSGKIAFQSDRTGAWQIFEAENIGGENRTRLISDGAGNDYDPTYNHAGTQIAFRSERNGEMGIYVMDEDGTDVTRISPLGYTASTPVWADGDRYIAYQASMTGTSLNDIFVYDTQTGETRQITANDDDLANTQDVAPTWLCNSLTLIFASDVSGNNRIYALPALPMTEPSVNLTDLMSWTENAFNNRDPQNTPSEENGSRMGALPPRFIP